MSKLIVNTIEAQTYKYDSDTTAITIDSVGRLITNSDRPSFMAYSWAGATTNGNGVGSNQDVWYYTTVQHNQGGHLVNTSTNGGTFTAPITGIYHMSGGYGYKNGTNHCGLHVWHNTTNIYRAWTVNTSPQHHNATWSAPILMTAGDTICLSHDNNYESPHQSTSSPYCFFAGIFMG